MSMFSLFYLAMTVFRFSKDGFYRSGKEFTTSLGSRKLLKFPLSSSLMPSTSQAKSLGPILSKEVEGLKSGFFLKLSLHGVGYRVWLLSSLLLFDLGYNSFLSYALPPGIGVSLSRANLLLYALDHHLITTVADQLIRLRPKDAYGGKGVRHRNRIQTLKKRKKDGK